MSAYGGLYSAAPQTLTLAANTPTQVALATTMPETGLTYTPANSATVTEAGTYELSYNAALTSVNAGDVTLSVRQNGTDLASTPITKTMTAGESALFSGTAVVTLAANDVLDLAVTSTTAGDVTLGSGVNAMLTVKRLN